MLLVGSWLYQLGLFVQGRATRAIATTALGEFGLEALAARPTVRPDKVRVERNIVFRRVAGRELKLDVYRPRTDGERRPAILQIHGGAWVIGDKREQGLPLLKHLAAHGWVGFNANYRLSPGATFPDHLVDLKAALAWIRDHADEYGVDPDFVVVTGGSAGGHLTALMALTANQARYQPGFEQADTSVAAAVPFYGIYDFTNRNETMGPEFRNWIAQPLVIKAFFDEEPERYAAASPLDQIRPDAPPFLIVHGDKDTLAPVADARTFAEQLWTVSQAQVVYVELKGAQHAFDVFGSPRTRRMVQATETFLFAVHEAYRHRARTGVGAQGVLIAPVLPLAIRASPSSGGHADRGGDDGGVCGHGPAHRRGGRGLEVDAGRVPSTAVEPGRGGGDLHPRVPGRHRRPSLGGRPVRARPALLAVASAVAAAGAFGFALTHSWIVLLVGAVLQGLSAGTVDAALNAQVALHHSHRMMNLMHGSFGVGATLGPLLMTALVGSGLSWRWGYAAMGVLQVGLVAGFVLTARSWARPAPSASPPVELGEVELPRGRWRQPRPPRPPLGPRGPSPAAGRGARTAGVPGLRRHRGGHRIVGVRAADQPGHGDRRGRRQRDRLLGRAGCRSAGDRRRRPPDLAPAGAGHVDGRRGASAGSACGPCPDPGATVALVVLGLSLAGMFPALMALTPTRVGPVRTHRVIANQLAASVIGGAAWSAVVGVVAQHAGAWAIAPALAGACVFLAVSDVLLTASAT